MPPTMPVTTQEHTLDATEAALLWNWVLARQGLSAGTKFQSVVDMSHSSLGLHSARLPSPYATALARATSPEVATSLFTSETQANLITLRCMRKTLHTLPLPLASAAHGATVHFRERDAQRAIVNADVPMSAISATIDAIVGLVDHGALHNRTIEARLVSSRRSVATVRLALKLAWERGILSYINASGCWNREHRTFAATASRYPGLDTALDRTEATNELIHAYFDRYGPATLKDATWWAGLSRAAILSAIAESGQEWVKILAPWSSSPMFMLRTRWEEFQASEPKHRAGGLHFLAHEDVALKAYFETRSRYLGSMPEPQAFNQIGEVLPTVLIDGQVTGTWAWQGPRKRAAIFLARGRTTPEQRKAASAHAATVTEALRLGWSNTPRSADDDQLALL